MGEAQGGQWPRRHRSRKNQNRARPRSLSPPLKRRRRRKTRSTVSSCQLPDGPRSGHGAQRLFCLHRRARARRQSATRSGLRVHLRRALLCAVALALARLADRRIRLQNAGIVADDPVTLVKLSDLFKPQALLAGARFLVIASLATRKVPVAIIIGVLGVTLVAVAFGLEPWHGLAARGPRSRRPSLT